MAGPCSSTSLQGSMPILNVKDLITKKVAMEVVPRKGNADYAVEVLTEFIKESGNKEVIIRSDQESAISALIDTVKV